MQITSLEQSILFTISYFDVFDYPVTSFEVWRYLFGFRADLDQVILKLDEMIRIGKIEMKYGFYFLPERSNLVRLRQIKYDISEKFWNRAVLAAKILSYVPFIKMIAIVNSLAFFNCDQNSDIDFFIVTQKNKIWTARAFSSLLLHILGLRRHGKKVAKRICLSFYISEEKPDLSYIAKDDLGFFVAFWIAQMAPIINFGQTFESFHAANFWTRKFLPNSGNNITDYYINFKRPLLSKTLKGWGEFLFKKDFFENTVRKIQMKRIEQSQKKWGNPKSVITNDYILKFHPIDLRVAYKEKLKKNLHR